MLTRTGLDLDYECITNRYMKKGMKQGVKQGQTSILNLMNYLFQNGRIDDAKRASQDEAYRNFLLAEMESSKQ